MRPREPTGFLDTQMENILPGFAFLAMSGCSAFANLLVCFVSAPVPGQGEREEKPAEDIVSVALLNQGCL